MFGRQRRSHHETLEQLVCGQQDILHEIAALGAKMSQMDDEIAKLTSDVAAERTAVDRAVTLINGIPDAIQKAVDAALAAGASPAQLQAITDLSAAVTQQSTDLANAVTADTPQAPTS